MRAYFVVALVLIGCVYSVDADDSKQPKSVGFDVPKRENYTALELMDVGHVVLKSYHKFLLVLNVVDDDKRQKYRKYLVNLIKNLDDKLHKNGFHNVFYVDTDLNELTTEELLLHAYYKHTAVLKMVYNVKQTAGVQTEMIAFIKNADEQLFKS